MWKFIEEIYEHLRQDRLPAFALAIQLILWILTGLNALGLNPGILTAVIGFIYLTFIPGVLILNVFRLRNLSIVEVLAYSVGLSLSVCLVAGLILNFLGPALGISRPLATLPLLTTMTIVVLSLCGLHFWQHRNDSNAIIEKNSCNFRYLLSPPVLFLLLIPLISILGALLVYVYHNNILLLLLIVIICITIALVGFNKFIPEKLYPLALFCIALALLYHITLVSPNLMGWDINQEYYFSQLTLTNSYWDSTIPNAYNSVLSITILPVTYFYLLTIDSVWIFKIIYPLFFSLVPIILYAIYRKQTSDRTAFLAVFFFISLELFFAGTSALMRQQIAELFFALLVILMVRTEMDSIKRTTLAMVFTFSLIVSHYSTSFIYLFYISLTWLVLYSISLARKAPRDSTFNGGFVVFFLFLAILWYMYLASSATFAAVVNTGRYIYNDFGDFFSSGSRDFAILRLFGLAQPLHILGANFYRITQLFIVIGVIRLLTGYRNMKFKPEYIIMTLLSLLLLFVCIVIPYFAQVLNVDRFYHLTLFFLSPFCILGGETLFGWLLKLIKMARSRIMSILSGVRHYESSRCSYDNPIYTRLVILLVLIPYFLVTTGFLYQVSGDSVPTSISLSQENYRRSNNEYVIQMFYGGYTVEPDVFSARWLSRFKLKDGDTYSDAISNTHVLVSYGMLYSKMIYPDSEIKVGSYIYMSRMNTVNGLINVPVRPRKSGYFATYNYATSELPLGLADKIYSTGESEIYLKR